MTCLASNFGEATSKVEYDQLISEWLAGGRQLPSADSPTAVELVRAYWNAVGKQMTGESAHKLQAVLGIVRKTYGMGLVPRYCPQGLAVGREEKRKHSGTRGRN